MRIKKLKAGFEKLTKEKARLIAHLIGDGCVYKCRTDYNIKYEVVDDDLLIQFEKDLVNVYGLIPTKGLNPSGKTGRLIPYVRLRSKLAYEDLLSFCNFHSDKWIVPNQIIGSSKEIKKEFLGALFDDEGSIIIKNKYFEIRLYSINFSGLKQVQNLINEFGISSKIRNGYGSRRNVYGLVINRDGERFDSEIGFNSIRKNDKLNTHLKKIRSSN